MKIKIILPGSELRNSQRQWWHWVIVLGEMNPSELAISTVHPDYNRTLIRYTTEDIEREINEIRRIDSNMKELLEDIDTNYEL